MSGNASARRRTSSQVATPAPYGEQADDVHLGSGVRTASVGHRPATRRLAVAVAALVALAVPAMLYGHAPDGLAAGQPAARAAQSLSVGDLRVQRRAPGGRVRASVAAGPAGTALDVVVRRGGRRVGHRTLTAASGPRTSFSVRLDRSSRARLRRVGHLDLKIDVSASGPGTHVSTGTTARVTG